jgi:hypothetical protein
MSTNTPAVPDYTGAAEKQAQASQAQNTAQTWANRPTVNTPWGSMTWDQGTSIDPSTGQKVTNWTGNVDLSPEQQQALDSQQQVQLGRSQLAGNLLGQAQTEMQTPIDWAGLPQAGQSVGDTGAIRQNAEDALYRRATSRLDPQWNQQEEQLRSRLANQGLDVGSEAATNAFGDFSRSRNDAYSSAMNDAITGGGTEAARQVGMETAAGQYQNTLRGQALTEEQQRQGGSMNLLNAALNGQQVGMPSMPGFSQAGQGQSPQLLAALNAQYQAQMNQYNANNSMWEGALPGIGPMIGNL